METPSKNLTDRAGVLVRQRRIALNLVYVEYLLRFLTPIRSVRNDMVRALCVGLRDMAFSPHLFVSHGTESPFST